MRRSRLRPGVQKLSALLMLGWPFFIWFGLTHNSLHWLLPLMALLLIVRLRQIRQMTGPMRAVLQSVALAGIALCIASSYSPGRCGQLNRWSNAWRACETPIFLPQRCATRVASRRSGASFLSSMARWPFSRQCMAICSSGPPGTA